MAAFGNGDGKAVQHGLGEGVGQTLVVGQVVENHVNGRRDAEIEGVGLWRGDGEEAAAVGGDKSVNSYCWGLVYGQGALRQEWAERVAPIAFGEVGKEGHEVGAEQSPGGMCSVGALMLKPTGSLLEKAELAVRGAASGEADGDKCGRIGKGVEKGVGVGEAVGGGVKNAIVDKVFYGSVKYNLVKSDVGVVGDGIVADKEVVAERRGGGGDGYAAQRQAVGKGGTGVGTNAVRQPRRGPVGIEGVGRVVEIRLFLASKAVVATEELLGINVCQIGVAECPLGVGIEFWECATHKGFRIDRVGKFGADLDKAHRGTEQIVGMDALHGRGMGGSGCGKRLQRLLIALAREGIGIGVGASAIKGVHCAPCALGMD